MWAFWDPYLVQCIITMYIHIVRSRSFLGIDKGPHLFVVSVICISLFSEFRGTLVHFHFPDTSFFHDSTRQLAILLYSYYQEFFGTLKGNFFASGNLNEYKEDRTCSLTVFSAIVAFSSLLTASVLCLSVYKLFTLV